MKKVLLAVVAVCLLMFPASGFSLDMDEISFGLHGGVFLPQGDFDDIGADMGFLFGGQAFMPSGMMDELAFGVSLDFGMTDGDYDLEYSGFELLCIARYYLPLDLSDLQVFGQLGLGFNMYDVEWDIPYYGSYSDDGTEFGFALGGGVIFMENFEAAIMYKSFDEADYITITVGYNFPN